jgi:hypothetical protein
MVPFHKNFFKRHFTRTLKYYSHLYIASMLIYVYMGQEKEHPQISKSTTAPTTSSGPWPCWLQRPPANTRFTNHDHRRRSLPVPSPRNQSQSKNPREINHSHTISKIQKNSAATEPSPLRSANTLVENRKITQTFKKHAEKRQRKSRKKRKHRGSRRRWRRGVAEAVPRTATQPSSTPARTQLRASPLQLFEVPRPGIGIRIERHARGGFRNCGMPPPAAMLLLSAAPGSPSLSLALAPRRAPLRAPRQRRLALRPVRIRAAAAIGGEFGGLGRRRVVVGEFIERLRNVLPGGSWWRLEDGDEAGEGGGRAEGSGTTALSALRRMWGLVAADRWVIYAGFASLVGAAVMRASHDT